MPTQNAELITQLNALLRLTAHEAATARARVAQATTDETRKELTENARNSDRRAGALRQAVRDLGGAPDLVGVYRDRFVRTEDTWRFAERRTEVTFVRG